MKLKKIISVLLLTAMAAGLLAGCGKSDGGKSDSNKGDSNKGGNETSVEGAEVTLTVWNEPNKNDELNMYLQAEKATGIKVNVNVIPESEYSSKLNQMVATKDDSADILVVWENDIRNFA